MSQPFFSAKLLRTAADGTYEAFAGTDRVQAFDDHFEIGRETIEYRDLIDLRLFGNVLHIVFNTPDGRCIERYFNYATFLASTGQRALSDMYEQVMAIKARMGLPLKSSTTVTGGASPPKSAESDAPRRAESLGVVYKRHAVAVFTSFVSFPPICPGCERPVETVASIRHSAGGVSLNEGVWYIPVCAKHRKLSGVVWAAPMKNQVGSFTFGFSNPRYALAFLNLNAQAPESRQSPEAVNTMLYKRLQMGVRFVVFRYAVGMLYLGMLNSSDIHEIAPEQGSALRSIPYSIFSLLAGWWAIPSGPIFTISALLTNMRGGIDITDQVRANLLGSLADAEAPGVTS